MAIIDAQVHAYERNHPGRPWAGPFHGPDEMTGEQMVAAMDAVGVDGAILVSVFAMYRYDASYAVQVRNAHPGRFALVKPVNPADPAVAETIADWKRTPGTVGVRIMMRDDVSADPADPGLNRVLAEAGRHGLAVNLLCYGRLDQVGALAARNPNTRLVVDHVGMAQPFDPPPPAEPFKDLLNLLALARHDNVVIKITGAGTYSHKPYPYEDIWDPLARIFDAFGFARCLWGTDWTRAVALLSYDQGVQAFAQNPRFSASDCAMLMGGAAERAYGWAPNKS